ncbi:hypothetical protein [Deinococcus maricopensis]|uniref:Uncharacterized protein n=1 Tax=Deinococcus maricopensis (strain DSM 21211 / LMG 22137 / NRRL B-23946 / LB-34) TaxID=709986 RepID=E8U8N8_DEIML|nr:hypothetical protein [Deinococcus maricopensis]ADV67427.1 hypothetical protein Deima_1779 [Deinococcus maricopensis DSM 21211]
MTEVNWHDVPSLARALNAPEAALHVKVSGRRVAFRAAQLVFLAADAHDPCVASGQPISGRFAVAIERPRAGRLGPLALTVAFSALGEDAARDAARTVGRLLGAHVARAERSGREAAHDAEHTARLAQAGSFPAYLDSLSLRWLIPVALGEEERFVTVPARVRNAIEARLERPAPLRLAEYQLLTALHAERERNLDAGVALGVPEFPALPPARPKVRVSAAVERAQQAAKDREREREGGPDLQIADEALERAVQHAEKHRQPLAPADWLAYLLRHGVVYSDAEYERVRAWLPLARRRALDRKLRRRFPLTPDELRDVQDAAGRTARGETPPSSRATPRSAPLNETLALRTFAELLAEDLARHGYGPEADALHTHRGGPLRLRWVQERFGGFARRLMRSTYETLPEDVLTEAVTLIRQTLPVYGGELATTD